MSLKHNIVFIILGLFLFKIVIFDNARSIDLTKGRKIAQENYKTYR
jgi:hypothetical protein